MRRLPKHRLDTIGLPPSERLDGWRRVIIGYDISLPPDTPKDTFAAAADVWDMGGISLTSARITRIRMGRSLAHARADRDESHGFLFVADGEWQGLAGDRPTQMHTGQIIGVDNRKTSDMVGYSEDSITITVSRNIIKLLAPRTPDLHGIALGDAAARLLSDHLMSLRKNIEMIDERDMPDVEQATLRLVGAALGRPSRNKEAEDAAHDMRIYQRVTKFIDDNLATNNLNAERICGEFGYSRSALYRAFKPGFGIAAYIRQQRLHAACRALTDPRNTEKIADIANRYGFVSDSHFSRVFRETYKRTPRDIRKQNNR